MMLNYVEKSKKCLVNPNPKVSWGTLIFKYHLNIFGE